MKFKLTNKKTAQRRMCDLAYGDCFIREGTLHKNKVFLVAYDGCTTHCIDLYSGELLESTDEIVTPVEATMEYTPWIEEVD